MMVPSMMASSLVRPTTRTTCVLLVVWSLTMASCSSGFVVVPTAVSVVGSFFKNQHQQQQQRQRQQQDAESVTASSSSSTLFQSTKEETSSSSSSTAVPSKKQEQLLDAKQLDFLLGYMNKHHESTLKKLATAFTPLGQEMNKMNTWSGGSMTLTTAKMVDVDTLHVKLSVQVEKRGKVSDSETIVTFPLDTNVVTGRSKYTDLPLVECDENNRRSPLDDIVRRLNRLCWMVQDEHVTGKLIQLALQLGGGNKKNGAATTGIGKIPDNLYLNQVPHNVYVRNYFYTSASQAVKDAVISCSLHRGRFCNRMQVISAFPEMNPSMDSYRIGTILEMCRDMCITLAEQNVRGTLRALCLIVLAT
jgi:Protein of unknown function (DUF2470)